VFSYTDQQLSPILLKHNLQFLVDNLNPEEKLIDSLWDCGLLSITDTKIVKSRLTTLEKSECLLVILSGKRKQLFCLQLKKENYGLMCIVNFLESGMFMYYTFIIFFVLCHINLLFINCLLCIAYVCAPM